MSNMLSSLEFRRQIFHIFFGILIIYFLNWGYLDLPTIFLLLVCGGYLIYLHKKKCKVPLVYKFLHWFEREEHLESFPGKGAFFYLMSTFLVLWLFPFEIAMASVAILALGDAVSNLVGYNFGRVRIFFKPKKSIEGTLAGILAGTLGGMFFTELHPLALLVASSMAMLAEIPHFKIGRLVIDDNLIIPLTAAITLNFIYFILV